MRVVGLVGLVCLIELAQFLWVNCELVKLALLIVVWVSGVTIFCWGGLLSVVLILWFSCCVVGWV